MRRTGGGRAPGPGSDGAVRKGGPIRERGLARSRAREGFVLIAVLWALVFVGMLAATFVAESAHLARISANRGAELEARYLARGALHRAENRLQRFERRAREVLPLLDPEGRTRLTAHWNDLDALLGPVATGCERQVCYGVAAVDLGARLNVNRASEEQLRTLFLELDLNRGTAQRAAGALVARIRPGSRARGGAGVNQVINPPSVSLPPGVRPLATLEELREIPGVGHLHDRIAPYLTTEGRGWINVNSAPGPVLATVPGMPPEAVSDILEARRNGVTITNPIELLRTVRGGGQDALRSRFVVVSRFVSFVPADIRLVGLVRSERSPVTVEAGALLFDEFDGFVRVRQW